MVSLHQGYKPKGIKVHKKCLSEIATRGVLFKKVFFEISQNSQYFPLNFAKFLRTLFLLSNSGRLLLVCGKSFFQ